MRYEGSCFGINRTSVLRIFIIHNSSPMPPRAKKWRCAPPRFHGLCACWSRRPGLGMILEKMITALKPLGMDA